MKHLFLIFLTTSCFSQNIFRLYIPSGTKEGVRTFEVEVNRTKVYSPTDTLNLKTNFPAFDTISFNYPNEPKREIIITRFHPGKTYFIGRACCGFIDFYDEAYDKKISGLYRAAGQENAEEYNDSVRIASIQSANIKFLLKNYTLKDTLVGIYGDWSNPNIGHVLKNNKSTEFTKASSGGYYTSNIKKIVIGQLKNMDNSKIKTGVIDEIVIPEIEVLKAISCRFFNDEKLIVTYYYDQKKMKLMLEK
jgi:hypothetical protein